MNAEPDLPDLDADVVADDDLLVEAVAAAVRYAKMTDPWLARLCEDRRVQSEMLRRVAPEAAAQLAVVEEATARLADHVVVGLVRWAFEAGARSASRGST